jgi:hypothetical protein
MSFFLFSLFHSSEAASHLGSGVCKFRGRGVREMEFFSSAFYTPGVFLSNTRSTALGSVRHSVLNLFFFFLTLRLRLRVNFSLLFAPRG